MSIKVHYGGNTFESDQDYEEASRTLFKELDRAGADGVIFWELKIPTGAVRLSLSRSSDVAIERVDEPVSAVEDRGVLFVG